MACKTKKTEENYFIFYFHAHIINDCGTHLDIKQVTHPDHVDTNEDVDWIVVGNALEHSHVRIKPCFSCDLFRQR